MYEVRRAESWPSICRLRVLPSAPCTCVLLTQVDLAPLLLMFSSNAIRRTLILIHMHSVLSQGENNACLAIKPIHPAGRHFCNLFAEIILAPHIEMYRRLVEESTDEESSTAWESMPCAQVSSETPKIGAGHFIEEPTKGCCDECCRETNKRFRKSSTKIAPHLVPQHSSNPST